MRLEGEHALVPQVLVERGINGKHFFGFLVDVLELTRVDEDGLDASSILEIAGLDVVQSFVNQLVALLLFWRLLGRDFQLVKREFAGPRAEDLRHVAVE